MSGSKKGKMRFRVFTGFELVRPVDELLKSGWQVKQTWYGLRICPCPCGKRDRGGWSVCAFVFRKSKTVVISFHLVGLITMNAIPLVVFLFAVGFGFSDRPLIDKVGAVSSFALLWSVWEFNFRRFLKREFLFDYDCVCRELCGLLKCSRPKRVIEFLPSVMIPYLMWSYAISWTSHSDFMIERKQ